MCIRDRYVDGHFVGNDYAIRRKPGTSTIIHADVPPARVITIEVSVDKDKREEGFASESDKSANSNERENPSAVSCVPHPSPQSNDSDSVVKSETDGKHSESPHNEKSTHSDSIPSSYAEA